MKIVFDEGAWDDHLHWQATDRKMLARLNNLLRECTRIPFAGSGKPEPLRGRYSGWGSRRLDQEHRLVYRVEGDRMLVAQCHHHY